MNKVKFGTILYFCHINDGIRQFFGIFGSLEWKMDTCCSYQKMDISIFLLSFHLSPGKLVKLERTFFFFIKVGKWSYLVFLECKLMQKSVTFSIY